MKLSDILGPNCDPKIIKETNRGFHFLKEQNITLYDEDFFISASMNYLKITILPLEYTDKMVKSLQILLHNMWVGQVLNKLK